MGWLFRALLAGVLWTTLTIAAAEKGFAQSTEARLAFVVGNSQYLSEPLTTPANDAGLVAQALQAAGFDVTGAADLDQNALQQAFDDFLDKVRSAPGAVVFVYLAGRGVQYAGENYFVPIDATIRRDADVPAEALRLADYTKVLAGLPLKARIFVLDAARSNPYAQSGAPLAGGLALVDAEPGSLYAFNAAPGTIAPDEQGPYGIYAQALVEMMLQGLPVDEIFAEARLRVNQVSAGAVIPWDVSNIDPPVFFFQRDADAPVLQDPADLNQPLRDYPASEAYAIALARDTMPAYQDFLIAFPSDPMAGRIRAILAARREALTWRRALDANSPSAYWTYMRRYPHGPHFADARRRLVVLVQPLDPPPRFDPYDFAGLPPPPESEYEIVDRSTLTFGSSDYPPPPSPRASILPERPAAFAHLPPPPRHESGILPIPLLIEVPFPRLAGRGPGTISQPSFGRPKPQSPGSGQGHVGPVPGEHRDFERAMPPAPQPQSLDRDHGGLAPGERPGSQQSMPPPSPPQPVPEYAAPRAPPPHQAPGRAAPPSPVPRPLTSPPTQHPGGAVKPAPRRD
jgi:uncharacterized caspase-like protein